MKLRIDIDCTPEEARDFFGLPEVKPMQESIIAEVEKKMKENIGKMDAEAMMKTWMPATIEGFEKLQKSFFSQINMGKKE